MFTLDIVVVWPSFIAARGRSLMVRAHGSCEAETRREEELMPFHHDDEQTKYPTATPVRPEGYGGVNHLGCCRASTMYQHRSRGRRLASGATLP